MIDPNCKYDDSGGEDPSLPSLNTYAFSSWIDWAKNVSLESQIMRKPPDEIKSPPILKIDDIPLYGACPARDELFLVVCELCGHAVKPQALKSHTDLWHKPGANSPVSNNIHPLPAKNKQLTDKVRASDKALSRSPVIRIKIGAGSTTTVASATSRKKEQKGQRRTRQSLRAVPDLDVQVISSSPIGSHVDEASSRCCPTTAPSRRRHQPTINLRPTQEDVQLLQRSDFAPLHSYDGVAEEVVIDDVIDDGEVDLTDVVILDDDDEDEEGLWFDPPSRLRPTSLLNGVGKMDTSEDTGCTSDVSSRLIDVSGDNSVFDSTVHSSSFGVDPIFDSLASFSLDDLIDPTQILPARRTTTAAAVSTTTPPTRNTHQALLTASSRPTLQPVDRPSSRPTPSPRGAPAHSILQTSPYDTSSRQGDSRRPEHTAGLVYPEPLPSPRYASQFSWNNGSSAGMVYSHPCTRDTPTPSSLGLSGSMAGLQNGSVSCLSSPGRADFAVSFSAKGGVITAATEQVMANRKALHQPLKAAVDRQYDPDLHCGVMDEPGQPCLKSIMCKVHSITSRRRVPNRSRDFKDLLASHRQARDVEKRERDAKKAPSGAPLTPASIAAETSPYPPPPPQTPSPGYSRLSSFDASLDQTVADMSPVVYHHYRPELFRACIRFDDPPSPSPSETYEAAAMEAASSTSAFVAHLSHHPRPIAMNTFGTRWLARGSHLLRSRREDSLRSALFASLAQLAGPQLGLDKPACVLYAPSALCAEDAELFAQPTFPTTPSYRYSAYGAAPTDPSTPDNPGHFKYTNHARHRAAHSPMMNGDDPAAFLAYQHARPYSPSTSSLPFDDSRLTPHPTPDQQRTAVPGAAAAKRARKTSGKARPPKQPKKTPDGASLQRNSSHATLSRLLNSSVASSPSTMQQLVLNADELDYAHPPPRPSPYSTGYGCGASEESLAAAALESFDPPGPPAATPSLGTDGYADPYGYYDLQPQNIQHYAQPPAMPHHTMLPLGHTHQPRAKKRPKLSDPDQQPVSRSQQQQQHHSLNSVLVRPMNGIMTSYANNHDLYGLTAPNHYQLKQSADLLSPRLSAKPASDGTALSNNNDKFIRHPPAGMIDS